MGVDALSKTTKGKGDKGGFEAETSSQPLDPVLEPGIKLFKAPT